MTPVAVPGGLGAWTGGGTDEERCCMKIVRRPYGRRRGQAGRWRSLG